MKADVKKMSVAFSDMYTAIITLKVSKYALRDMPDDSKPLEVEIRRKRKKRSLSANAYCWVLCQKIAERIRFLTKEDVYRNAIRNAGVWFPAKVPKGRADDFKACWEGNGIGWLAVPMDTGSDFAEFQCYKGSSVYNSEEMQNLLDELVEEAKGLGIETATPIERARLIDEWN